jgi:hypothetical protein
MSVYLWARTLAASSGGHFKLSVKVYSSSTSDYHCVTSVLPFFTSHLETEQKMFLVFMFLFTLLLTYNWTHSFLGHNSCRQTGWIRYMLWYFVVLSQVPLGRHWDNILSEGPRPVFSPLSLFWKNKSRRMRSPCCLFISISPISTFECMNQSLLNLVCISWHLIPSQRCTS